MDRTVNVLNATIQKLSIFRSVHRLTGPFYLHYHHCNQRLQRLNDFL